MVVNAADIASRPPAAQTYLIVNWGDSGNNRIGCGACRLGHGYTPGRYTGVATTDDLQPGTVTHSITFTVDVAPAETPGKKSPFAGLVFQPSVMAVGDTGIIFLPNASPVPPDIIIDATPLFCTPLFPQPIAVGPPFPVPGGLGFDVFALAPGTCSAELFSHDLEGHQFHDVATVTIF